MTTSHSLISLEDLKRLNDFALSDAPSAHENLTRSITQLATANASMQACGVPGYLIVGGDAAMAHRGYLELAALLDLPEHHRHPVMQVMACVALLRRGREGMPEEVSRAHPREEVQRRLSHLLIEYPVLMDSRLLFTFSVAFPTPELTTLAAAIAETSFASLPSKSDGLTDQQLRHFASNRCVRSGLSRAVPAFLNRNHKLRHLTPLRIACGSAGETVGPAEALATRGGFLLSLLQLNALARTFTGRGVLADLANKAENGDLLYGALARVFWDVALNDGAHSAVTRPAMVEVMQLRSPFAATGSETGTDKEYDRTVATAIGSGRPDEGVLNHALSLSVDLRLFCSEDSQTPTREVVDLGADAMRERTQKTLKCMVDIGLKSDLASAAQWLSTVCVGRGRMDGGSLAPRCGLGSAMGFLEAVLEHGASVGLDLGSAGRRPGAAEGDETWKNALDVVSTKKAMESVCAQHASAAPAQAEPPISRARLRLL